MTKKPKPTLDPSGLPPAFPSSPLRPPKYIFHCYNHERQTHIEGLGLCEMYAAAHFFLAVIGEDKYSWDNAMQVTTEGGIQVRCPELQDIVEYELKTREKVWELPEPYVSQVRLFRDGLPKPATQPVLDAMPKAKLRELQRQAADLDKEATGQRKKREGVQRKVREKVVAAGMITAGQLATEMKITPRELRGMLRASGAKKGEGGWLWSRADADKLKKTLGKAAASGKKKGKK